MTNPPIDIEHWRPKSRHDFVGNYKLREYIEDCIVGMRQEGRRGGYNAVIFGDSRSGKTESGRCSSTASPFIFIRSYHN